MFTCSELEAENAELVSETAALISELLNAVRTSELLNAVREIDKLRPRIAELESVSIKLKNAEGSGISIVQTEI